MIKISEKNNDIFCLALFNKKNRNIISWILLAASFMSFLFPLVILLVAWDYIGFGFIITILIFWGSGVFFLRKFLWNFYGKEVFQISQKHVLHYYDYRFFKDNIQNLHYSKLHLNLKKDKLNDKVYSVNNVQNLKNQMGFYLCFMVDNESITSEFKVEIEDIKKIQNKISSM